MSEPYHKGKALFKRFAKLYQQHLDGVVPNGISAKELKYAIEIMEIMAGKYGECAGIPNEEYMYELLEKADNSKKQVGYIEYATERTDAATGMIIMASNIDGNGYIGIL